MALPGIDINVVDGNLSLTRPGSDRMLVVGPSSLGTAVQFNTFAQIPALIAKLGRGPAVTAAAHIISQSGSVDVLSVPASVAAFTEAVTHVGASGGAGTGGTLTVAGTPTEIFIVTVRIRTGGAKGVARFDYTLDAQTYSAIRTVPTSGTFVVPETGLTLTFDDTSDPFVEGETYKFSSLPKTLNADDIDDAAEALSSVGTRWKAILWVVHPLTRADAVLVAEQIGVIHGTLADQARMSRAIVTAGGLLEDDAALFIAALDDDIAAYLAAQATYGAAVRAAYESFEDIRVALFAGLERLNTSNRFEGWHHPFVPCSYSAAGRVAKYTRATNVGWVGAGRLERVSAIMFDERVAGEQLHDIGVNTTRTHVGRNGPYFTNGLLKAPIGSDFRYLSWGLAFDLLAEVTHDALLPFVNSSVRINGDGSGTIHPFDSARIEGVVNAAIRNALLEPLNDQGFKGYLTDARFTVDRTHNVLATSTLLGEVRGVPLANLEQINATAGLFTALASLEVTAEAAE
jgi:hypothetical protein